MLHWLGSLVILAISLPLMVLTALAIKLDSAGPVFYRQERVGYNSKLFLVTKFRSMRTDAERHGAQWAAKDDPRVTRVGGLIRKVRIDELPQLWNVLCGHMSVVGPRPEVPRYVDLYTPEQRAVLSVRPGITGMASIDYIDESEILARASDPESAYVRDVMPAKLALDLRYVRERSFALDLRIISATIGRVFFGWR